VLCDAAFDYSRILALAKPTLALPAEEVSGISLIAWSIEHGHGVLKT
jgi:hypothetical protein